MPLAVGHGVFAVVVVDGVLAEHPEDWRVYLVFRINGRTPAVGLAWIIARNRRAPDGESIGGDLVAADRESVDIVFVGQMSAGDRVEVPTGDRLGILAPDSLELGHRGVGELHTLLGRVTNGEGNVWIVIPFEPGSAPPVHACSFAVHLVHLEPEADLVVLRHTVV